jgi:hypothetical protein
MKENEFKKKWEEWYGDMLSGYQWNELEYKGKKLIYVCGRFSLSDDGNRFASNFTQVIGYADFKKPLNEEEQNEVRELFKCQQGIENLSFWGAPFS